MRRGSSLVILLVALLLGGAAAFLARNWLERHAHPVTADDSTTIVVANGPLTFGAAVTASDVRAIRWPADARPEGAFSSVDDLLKDGRRVVLSPLVRDEPIVPSKVSAPNGRASLSTVIEPGKRAVTIAVDDVRGVAGFIFPGDFVDVALTRTNSAQGPQDYSEVILQHVKVLAIDQVAGDRQERPTVAKAVTLEVTPDEALKTLLATNVGKLSLILRQAAEAALLAGRRITESDLAGSSAPAAPAPGPPAASAPSEPAAAPAQPPFASAEPAPSEKATPKERTRKVTVVRSLKGEDYDVPVD